MLRAGHRHLQLWVNVRRTNSFFVEVFAEIVSLLGTWAYRLTRNHLVSPVFILLWISRLLRSACSKLWAAWGAALPPVDCGRVVYVVKYLNALRDGWR